MSSDDYIIITESHNMGDDKDEDTQREDTEPSMRALEEHGVFIDQENGETMNFEPHDKFSKELQEIGGIEIITSGEDEALK